MRYILTLAAILSFFTSQAFGAASLTPAFSKWSSAGLSVDAGKQGTNTMQVIGATFSKPGGKPTMTILAPFARAESYASLAAAVAAIGATPTTLSFSADQTVSANLSIPATLELMPLNGAKVNHTSYTIDYAGTTARWPIAQVFNGTGLVTLSGTAVVYPQWQGVTADGTTDNAATITAADATAAASNAVLTFPPGVYAYASKITATALEWRMLGTKGTSNQLKWTGAAGATTIDWSGSGSSGGFSNFYFYYGTNKPATWVNIINSVDQRFKANFNHYGPCTGDAVVVAAGWVNLQWQDLRWDSIGGYAIRSIVAATQSSSHWSVNNFTIDNTGAGGSPGVFAFDNVGDTAKPSTVSVSNARVEGNTGAFSATTSSIVRLLPAADGTPGGYPIHISDIALASGTGITHVLYSDTTAATSLPTLTLTNWSGPAIPAIGIAGGIWTSAVSPTVTAGNYSLKADPNNAPLELFGSPLNLTGFDSSLYPFTIRVRTDSANKRLQINSIGKIEWGPGGATAVDTALYRSAAGILTTDGILKAGQFSLTALNTAPASATTTCTTGELRIDASYIYACVGTNTWKRSALTTW